MTHVLCGCYRDRLPPFLPTWLVGCSRLVAGRKSSENQPPCREIKDSWWRLRVWKRKVKGIQFADAERVNSSLHVIPNICLTSWATTGPLMLQSAHAKLNDLFLLIHSDCVLFPSVLGIMHHILANVCPPHYLLRLHFLINVIWVFLFFFKTQIERLCHYGCAS